MSVEDLLSHPLLWRGQDAGLDQTPAIPTGFAALDRYLPGGGWPLSGISEIFIERYGLGELSVLMPALARLSQRAAESKKWIVWIAPPYVPYAPALAHHGVELSRILLVHPKAAPLEASGSEPFSSGETPGECLCTDCFDATVARQGWRARAPASLRLPACDGFTACRDKAVCAQTLSSDALIDKKGSDPEASRGALWAVEQAIRSQASAATLAWVREADMAALRRLQLSAETFRCWTVLFRPVEALKQSSPAALRFRLSSGSGRTGIGVEIHKCRGRKPRSFEL